MKRIAYKRGASRRQRGFTMLELLAAIVIMAICSVPLVIQTNKFVMGQRDAAIGLVGVNLHNAVNQYISQNQAFIATQPMPYTITTAMLSAPTVYLDPSYTTTNTAGQVPSIRVIEDADGSLEVAIAMTGGQVIKDGDLDGIAAYMVQNGAAGGAIETGATSVATGFNGGWSKDLSAFGLVPGAGHVVDFLTYSANATVDDSLHRTSHPGNPQLNQMQTAIDMATNNINNVGTLGAGAINVSNNTNNWAGITLQAGAGAHNWLLASAGSAWGGNAGALLLWDQTAGRAGAILDANGALNLNGGNNINMGGSWLYGDSTNLALRPAANGGTVYIQGTVSGGGAANLWVGGSATVNGNVNATGGLFGSSVTSSGDVTAAGAVYASNWVRTYGATGWFNQTYGGGWYMADGTWVRSYNDKSVYTGGTMQAGNLVSTGTVNILGLANVGWGCSAGTLAQDSDGSGQMVECKNGVWTTMGGFHNYTIVQGSTQFGMNQSVATCPAGWTMLSGGAVVNVNPYVTLPGVESVPANSSQWVSWTTDIHVGTIAYAYCGS